MAVALLPSPFEASDEGVRVYVRQPKELAHLYIRR